ncbi:Ku protein [Streptomyces decoyicus]|uniref:Ku protein n=1 Tax=Streptomyces decoyicus TaxID=249567 RepID=UPI0036565FB8
MERHQGAVGAVLQVVARGVDSLLYARPYWMGARGAGAQKPYALLVEALVRSGRLAVCKVALRSRERLAILRPRTGSSWPASCVGDGNRLDLGSSLSGTLPGHSGESVLRWPPVR